MIDKDRYRRIDEIFQAALELEPRERASYVSQECSGDAALLKEVEYLLSSDGEQWELIGTPAFEMLAPLLAKDQPELEAGDAIGHYQIVSLLGVGGMGQVYLAEDATLRRKVALKLLPTSYTRDESRLRRFQQEARAASALNHPNILTIHELGEVGGEQFIATEFVEGETLRERLQRAPLNLAETLDVAVQIAGALAAAHKAGIVHRDIKPENIMLRHDGYVKVLDFGLAKLTEQPVPVKQTTATENVDISSGLVMGTVKYMSPEQAGGRQVDPRSDIFSFGVVLYEMIAGRAPFAGKNSDELISAILKKEPPTLTDVPEEIQRLISRALRKKKEDRYQTIEELLADLKSLKEDKTVTIEYVISKIKRHKTATALGFVTLVILLAGVGYLGYRYFFIHRAIPSIAVMPFVNESGNAELEYLSDGMTETLGGRLSKLPGLQVKATSSVFRYKGKNTDAPTVGKELNVSALFYGHVVQRGEDLNVHVELVDTQTGNILWEQTYNKKRSNLIVLQGDIARDLVRNLRVNLSGAEEQKLVKNYTENVEAYELFQKGRFHQRKLTPPEIKKGIDYFQQAIDTDPSYALAYTGIVSANIALALAGDMNPGEVLPKAKAAAQKALEIEDTLAEAHNSIGAVFFWYDWNWKKAEEHFIRSVELDPKSSFAHYGYADFLSKMGRPEEALEEIKRARELDPLSPYVNTFEAWFLNNAGQPDAALDSVQSAIDLDPNFFFAYWMKAEIYRGKKMYPESIAESRQAKALAPNQTWSDAGLAYTFAATGQVDESRAILNEMLRLSESRWVPPYHIALVYNALGDTNQALAWLEKGYKHHDPKMALLKEERWNNLRDDPRFKDILRRVGFDDAK